MKIAVTGHRPERIKGHEKEIYEWFKKKFAAIHPEEIITGMAEGVDRIAAQAAKDMKIPYLCVYPYKKKSFSFEENELIQNAAGVVYLSENFYYGCYHARDKFMVDRANKVLVVWDGKTGGGTYFTMNYANDKNKIEEILILN